MKHPRDPFATLLLAACILAAPATGARDDLATPPDALESIPLEQADAARRRGDQRDLRRLPWRVRPGRQAG